MKTKQETTVEANRSISKLLSQKRKLENSVEQKNWVWQQTIEEHYGLATIDVKLIASGHYDRVIQ